LTTALYGPLVLYDLELLPPVLVHVLLAGALGLSFSRRAVGVVDAALGLLVGLAVTGWPLSLAFLPLVLALRSRRLATGRERAVGFALGLFLSAVPLAFTARHNAQHDGEGVVVSYNAGINLWLGNNPNWRATWRARPGAEFEPELERPDREGVTKPSERVHYYARRVWRDIVERPGGAFGRTLEKYYYVWHGREIRRDQDIELLREASPILRGLVWEAGLRFPFGLVGPLALLALVRRRHEPDVQRLALFAATYALTLAIFFVSSRYRLPLALSLMPLAVDQVFHFARAEAANVRGLWAFGATFFALNLPNAFTRGFRADDAERGILEAQAWRNQGKLERAAPISEELVGRFPNDPNVRMLRAEVLVALGRCDAAVPELERAIALAPKATTPRVMLGSCFDELGSPAEAERAFASALSLHPHHALALARAGTLYARHGRLREARSLLTRFVADGYDDPEVTDLLRRISSSLERRIAKP
jgi:tetratricopeptide (TPR) repeat protein